MRTTLPRKFWEYKSEELLEEWDNNHLKHQPGTIERLKLEAKIEQASTIIQLLHTMDAEVERIRKVLEREVLGSAHIQGGAKQYAFESLSKACKYHETNVSSGESECLYNGRGAERACVVFAECPLSDEEGEE